MTRLEKIEELVAALSDSELTEFAAWFDELRWAKWDQQVESDVAAGRLNRLANQALSDLAAGRTRPL